MAFVYILKSVKCNKYYIGSTINLDQRLRQHFSGTVPSTKSLLPLELVLKQEYATLGEARKVEYRLKNFKRRDYIEKIVNDGTIAFCPCSSNG